MTTPVTLQERLEEATEDLRACATSAAVAEILRREGVRGRPGNCDDCPLAVLVMLRLGAGVSVSVTDKSVCAWTPGDEICGVNWTPPVSAFIREFDGPDDEHLTGEWREFRVAS